ncbi:MAG: hypothetical protein ABI634_02690 [Acidobacteriota bacterium]
MSRMYSVVFASVAITAQQDLFEIVAASGKPCVIHSIEIEQSTEVGDAQEEGLSLLWKDGSTTSGSGGSAPTPAPQTLGDAAAGFASEVNNTTKATAGTILTKRAWNWNVRMPFLKVFTPETRPVIAGGARATLELATTPADSITVSGTIMVEELG